MVLLHLRDGLTQQNPRSGVQTRHFQCYSLKPVIPGYVSDLKTNALNNSSMLQCAERRCTDQRKIEAKTTQRRKMSGTRVKRGARDHVLGGMKGYWSYIAA